MRLQGKMELSRGKERQKQNYDTSPSVQACLDVNEAFKKNIENYITKIQSVQQSKAPQRCFLHNNIITLYCELDRKPLCAGCMYQSDMHRKHRVMPLNKAIPLVKEDIKAFEIKLEDTLLDCVTFQRKISEQLIKSERVYPELTEKIKNVYSGLKKMIKQKEEEHIEQVKELKEKQRRQYLILNQQTTNIVSYITEKIKKFKLQDEETLVARRSCLEILIKANHLIKKNLVQLLPIQQQMRYMRNLQTFTEIQDFLRGKLVLSIPGALVSPKPQKRVTFLTENKKYKSSSVSRLTSQIKSPGKNILKGKSQTPERMRNRKADVYFPYK